MAVVNLPYSPIHTEQWLNKYLRTNYYKKNYDRFMWWRGFTPRNKPLTNNHPLPDRILNGDFDMGSFSYEIELVEHRLNQRYERLFDDPGRLRIEDQMDKARRKRLIEDRDKDEHKKLEDLKRAILFEFKMTREQYDKEVVKYRGPDLINFYYRMADKYAKYARRLTPIPKFH